MKDKNKIIKFISSILVILIIIPTILFSTPKKAEAGIPVMDVGPHAWARTIFTGITSVSSPVTATGTTTTAASTTINTGISVKNFFLEIIRQGIMVIERKALQKVTQGMVKWINSGFHGAPLFLENPGSFFKDIAKTEIKTLINDFGYDPSRFPFGKDFALNTINAYQQKLNSNAAYSLSTVMKDPIAMRNYRNNFNVGGWNGFLINTQYPQNNYLGFQMMATDQLARKLQGTTQNAAQKVQTTLNQGMGFLSPKSCPSNPNYNNGKNEFQRPSFDASTIPLKLPDCSTYLDESYRCDALTPEDQLTAGCDDNEIKLNKCNNDWSAANADYNAKLDTAKAAFNDPNGSNVCPGGLVNTTPGSVVANQITTALGSSTRQSELGAALGNSLGAIFDALINKFISTGLTGLANTVNGTPPSPPDNFGYETHAKDGPSDINGNTNTNTAPTLSLTANPESVSIGVDDNKTINVTISGGQTPYSVNTDPDITIASILITNAGFKVVGVAPGNTSFTVQDSSTPVKTITIPITITTNTNSGSCSNFGITTQSECQSTGGIWTVQ